MTLQPLTPLDLPTLASLLRNGGEIACDWLLERFADLGVDPAGQQATGDVLLLYARDEVACPDSGEYDMTYGGQSLGRGRFPNPDCLLAAHFTEALLARWLGMVGDGRAEIVQDARVAREDVDGTMQWCTWLRTGVCDFAPTESAARLDLKRRVLMMFGEVERTIKAASKDVKIGTLYSDYGFILAPTAERPRDDGNGFMVQSLHPIDFLPPESQTLMGLPIVWTDGPSQLTWNGDDLGVTGEPQGIIHAPATPPAQAGPSRSTLPERQRNRKKERRRSR